MASAILDRYEPVIGLEVHCQLKTATKLFCSCSQSFGETSNKNTCPVCLGLPGALPVLNEAALRFGVMLALAVDGDIQEHSTFERKQYFYPDLPKGYQISQYQKPFCVGGHVMLPTKGSVELERIHFEEDAGKLIHGGNSSYIDLNRAGVPLLEIVSRPQIHSPIDASGYLRNLRAIVRHLGVSDGNMEEGSFRCDVNISLRKRGETRLGTKVEVKNLNSFKHVERAIEYEIIRQSDLIDNGIPIVQSTMGYDPAAGKTYLMRTKESAQDYRYFPDPDLPTVCIDQVLVDSIREELPELPNAIALRLERDHGLKSEDARTFGLHKSLCQYFEETVLHVGQAVSAQIVANWILTDLTSELDDKSVDEFEGILSSSNLAEMLRLLGEGTISGKIGKTILKQMIATKKSAKDLVDELGLSQISDESEIKALVAKVVSQYPDQVHEYRGGKTKVFGFFVGQIMRASQGRMNPTTVNEVLKKILES